MRKNGDEEGRRAEPAAAGGETRHCAAREQMRQQKTGTLKSGNVPTANQQGPWAQICTSIAQIQCSALVRRKGSLKSVKHANRALPKSSVLYFKDSFYSALEA